jgi:hypothetical protein
VHVATVEANGGRVIGRRKHALGQQRFLRPLLEAQAAKPDVVALGSAGEDLVNLVKQGFDLRSISQGDIVLTAPAMAITSVHEIGLPLAQGILLPSAYYWDLDARLSTAEPEPLPPRHPQARGLSRGSGPLQPLAENRRRPAVRRLTLGARRAAGPAKNPGARC